MEFIFGLKSLEIVADSVTERNRTNVGDFSSLYGVRQFIEIRWYFIILEVHVKTRMALSRAHTSHKAVYVEKLILLNQRYVTSSHRMAVPALLAETLTRRNSNLT